jgi:plasmid stabilization system protein ParE
MARGDKDTYTDKQKRKAEHIAEGYSERGVSKKEAKARAWATVNKESGGGNKSGSGRGKPDTKVSSRKGGRKGGKAVSAASRSEAAKKGWETRRRKAGTTAKKAGKKTASKKAGKKTASKKTGKRASRK